MRDAGNWFRRLGVLLGMSGFLAQARGTELSDLQLRDGMTKLAAFVAADVPHDARWVAMRSQGRRFGIFTQEEDVFSSEGNAFLFAEKPGAEARIMVIYSGAHFTVKAEKENEEQQRNERREYRAVWKNADVTKDVTAAAEWLTKETAKAKGSGLAGALDPFSSSSRNRNDPAVKLAQHQHTALLWAAMLMHTGHEAEAMKLGKLAFGDASEEMRKEMLNGFFNRIAAPAMQEVMRAFGESRDWAKLRDGLDALVKKFPQGWQQRDAVRVFLHHVTERAKLPAEPPLKTKQPLPEADQKLLLAWVKEMEGGKSPEYSRWTLPALPDAETQGERVNATDFPHSHGLAAVPLLAALLSDDTLTSVGAANLNDRGYSFSSGSNDDAAQKLRNAYSQLQKPPTRAALAWSALERVLPNELRSGDESDHAALAPDILAWHESVKDASPADLALAYIEAGDRDDDVLAHALTLTDEKKMARLENAMIENVSVYDLNTLAPLVEKLGAKAAPFIAKVRQKLEGDLSRFGDGQEQQRKQMESALKRLEATAKDGKKNADLPGLLAELAKFDPQAQEEEDQMVMRQAYQELPKLMKKLTFAVRVEAIVKALPDFKSTAFAAQMLSFALRSESEPKAEERLAVLERTKEHWTRLLDRKEEASANDESADDEPPGLLVQTVGALQTLATGTANFEAGRYLGALGPRGAKLLREHGAALLAGQKPAPLPQVSGISSDTRKQALAEWASKSAAEIQSGIAALEIDKLIVLNEALTREPDLPPNLKTYIAQIHNVIFTGVTDKTPWQALRDHAADRPTVIDIARRVSTFEGAGFLSATMQRGLPVFGWKLIVKEETKPPKNWQFQQLKSRAENIGEHLPKLAKRAASGFFGAGRMNANWTWFDAPITEAPDEKTPAPSKPENDELAGAAASMQEARNDEVRGWQTVFKALEESKPDAATLFFFSAATPTLFEPKAK